MLKKILLSSCAVLIIIAALYFFYYDTPTPVNIKMQPSEWFYYQRAFPERDIPIDKYFKAINEKLNSKSFYKTAVKEKWIASGPSNIGGRITALEVDPVDKNLMYAASAAGGLFKTTDGGKSWTPKTDFYPSLSLGALKMDPNNSSILYLGTGEANISTDSYPGFGMLKSIDKGETWFLLGLENTRHIAEIEVHPLNSRIVYAACSGALYSKSEHRGIYKSADGGTTWKKVLFISDSTSAIDVAIDPQDTNIVYAAMWERLRGPSFRKASGLTTGLYKSTDAGKTWKQLKNGLPEDSKRNGRISIAVSKSNPDYIYALYKKSSDQAYSDNIFGSFYKSTDKGETWTKKPDHILPGEFSNFGWYFGLIEVDPDDPETVIIGEIDLLKSTNGGTSWTNITYSYSGPGTFIDQHPDQHALWIDKTDNKFMVAGNDGGIFTTTDGGNNWTKLYDLPVSQFYASTVDFLKPERKYGGTQDNGTLGTKSGNSNDWDMIYGGDGFHTLVDYTDSDIIYAEYQWNGLGKSTDGGISFYWARNGVDENDRTNWSTPVVMDNEDNNILYLGTYRVYATIDGAENWEAVSPDLTRGVNGRLGTITCISTGVLNNNERVIYAGTDDGKLSVSTNTGTDWKDVTGDLPLRYITDVLADKRNPSTAYVTLSGYNKDESNPHIFRTTDYGSHWKNISGNMPDVPLNSVIIDYDRDSVLYVGGDAGVFYTTNFGSDWFVLGEGLPNSPVFDLNYHQPTKKLFAATHGRSMFEIDISGIVTNVTDRNIAKNFILNQNYPNPFNPETMISFRLPQDTYAEIKVFDINGREVALAAKGYYKAGMNEIHFNGGNISSGVYFYRLQTDNHSLVKKMILLR